MGCGVRGREVRITGSEYILQCKTCTQYAQYNAHEYNAQSCMYMHRHVHVHCMYKDENAGIYHSITVVVTFKLYTLRDVAIYSSSLPLSLNYQWR